MATVREPDLLDVLAVLLVFFGLTSPGILWVGWRIWKEVREERRLDKLEAERMRAEGFPPPDPPTTDSQVP